MKSYKQTVCHRETIKWVKAVESVGIEYITIHGRRRTQRSTEPVNVEAIKLIKSSVTVPVVLNGDAFSIDDATRMIRGHWCRRCHGGSRPLANPSSVCKLPENTMGRSGKVSGL